MVILLIPTCTQKGPSLGGKAIPEGHKGNREHFAPSLSVKKDLLHELRRDLTKDGVWFPGKFCNSEKQFMHLENIIKKYLANIARSKDLSIRDVGEMLRDLFTQF